MPKYIDLTGTLAPGMWSYGGDGLDMPPFEQRRFATIEERGWEADWFAMPTLAGTYFETAAHLMHGQPSIDEVPLERGFVDATIARIPKGPSEHITAADLAAAVDVLNPGDALIVATGWEKHWWDSGAIFVGQSPHFDREAMQWMVDRGISILAGDMPCFDDPRPEGSQAVNTILFGSGAMILAPLVNLAAVSRNRVRLVVLPIKLKGACGAPCRVVAIED